MSSIKRISLLALLAAVAVFSGCATRPRTPWKRGAFASYGMEPDRDPLAAAMNEHIYTSRENSSGGAGVGGAGCGCN